MVPAPAGFILHCMCSFFLCLILCSILCEGMFHDAQSECLELVMLKTVILLPILKTSYLLFNVLLQVYQVKNILYSLNTVFNIMEII